MTHPRAAKASGVTSTTWAALAIIVAVGLFIQLTNPTNADVSWLFVVGDKMLSGQRLYIDIIETNPPMSVFLYMPAVVLARLVGTSAETNQIAITFALVAFALGLSVLIMLRGGRADAVGTYLLAGSQAMLVLPAAGFAQREHLAAILVLPSLALLVARAEGSRIRLWMALAAGAAAGLAATIKPHFAVAILLPALLVAVRLKSARSLMAPEHLVAVAIVLGYVAAAALAFPAYFDAVLPLVADTYRTERQSLEALALHPQLLIDLGLYLSVLLLAGRDARQPSIMVPLLGSAGFLFAYFEQGKGWGSHLLPASLLAYMVAYTVAVPRISAFVAAPAEQTRRVLVQVPGCVLALVGLVMLMPCFTFSSRSSLPLVPQIERLAHHPRILAISSYIQIGHPLTRAVAGDWVGTYCSQWLESAAQDRSQRPDTDAATRIRMRELIAQQRQTIVHDIRTGRPDVILVDRLGYDWSEAVATTPGLADELAPYAKIADANGIDLLVRRDLPASGTKTAAAAGAAPQSSRDRAQNDR